MTPFQLNFQRVAADMSMSGDARVRRIPLQQRNEIMPDDWNKNTWGQSGSWKQGGEEWSAAWGGSKAQWFGSIHPRISRRLPTGAILEIAPGFGRWTQFLRNLTSREYFGVDNSSLCIQEVAGEFNHYPRTRFLVNDGYSLAAIPDKSVDFVFSYDSLVHAEIDASEACIPQILKKLTPNGIAFLHHSNAADHHDPAKPHNHMRALSVSDDRVRGLIELHKGHLLIQETIKRGNQHRIDCFSTFCRRGSVFVRPTVKLTNNRFMEKADLIRQFHAAYHSC